MNSEALRLLDELNAGASYAAANEEWDSYNAAEKQLRARLSAQEPTAEHWRQAIREEIGEVVISDDELQRIEQRARELSKQTNCTASDDTPSKSRAKRIEKQREAK